MIIIINKKEHEVEITKDTPTFLEIRGMNGKGIGVIHKDTGKGRYIPNTSEELRAIKGHHFFLDKSTLALIKKEIKNA